MSKGIEQIAVNMIKAGKPDLEIAEMTGLDLSEIKQLRENLDV